MSLDIFLSTIEQIASDQVNRYTLTTSCKNAGAELLTEKQVALGALNLERTRKALEDIGPCSAYKISQHIKLALSATSRHLRALESKEIAIRLGKTKWAKKNECK